MHKLCFHCVSSFASPTLAQKTTILQHNKLHIALLLVDCTCTLLLEVLMTALIHSAIFRLLQKLLQLKDIHPMCAPFGILLLLNPTLHLLVLFLLPPSTTH